MYSKLYNFKKNNQRAEDSYKPKIRKWQTFNKDFLKMAAFIPRRVAESRKSSRYGSTEISTKILIYFRWPLVDWCDGLES